MEALDNSPKAEVTGFEPALRQFEEYLLLDRAYSPNTRQAYVRDVERFISHLSDENLQRTPLTVVQQDIETFMGRLGELGLEPTTQARMLSAVKGFFSFLVYDSQRTTDPTELVKTPRLPKYLPTVLTFDEVERMLSACDMTRPDGVRNRAMLEMLYGSGLRVSELVGLKNEHLFLELGYVRVIGKGNKERLVPASADAARYLQLYRDSVRSHQQPAPGSEHFVFLSKRNKPLSRVMMFMIVRDLAKLAGIQRTVSPHTLRHSFATHLVEGGADLRSVQEMLGHENIVTTEIYTHLNIGQLRDTLERFHPMGSSFGGGYDL